MSLSVSNPEADALAQILAKRAGESLARTPPKTTGICRRGELLALERACAALPGYDLRTR